MIDLFSSTMNHNKNILFSFDLLSNYLYDNSSKVIFVLMYSITKCLSVLKRPSGGGEKAPSSRHLGFGSIFDFEPQPTN